MIDITTLPSLPANSHIDQGQRFVIKGRNFNEWPAELVCSYDESIAQNGTIPHNGLFRLVAKSYDELVLEATKTGTLSQAHVYRVFAAPFNAPRTLLEYRQMV